MGFEPMNTGFADSKYCLLSITCVNSKVLKNPVKYAREFAQGFKRVFLSSVCRPHFAPFWHLDVLSFGAAQCALALPEHKSVLG
jgi:hypothetical protein